MPSFDVFKISKCYLFHGWRKLHIKIYLWENSLWQMTKKRKWFMSLCFQGYMRKLKPAHKISGWWQRFLPVQWFKKHHILPPLCVGKENNAKKIVWQRKTDSGVKILDWTKQCVSDITKPPVPFILVLWLILKFTPGTNSKGLILITHYEGQSYCFFTVAK